MHSGQHKWDSSVCESFTFSDSGDWLFVWVLCSWRSSVSPYYRSVCQACGHRLTDGGYRPTAVGEPPTVGCVEWFVWVHIFFNFRVAPLWSAHIRKSPLAWCALARSGVHIFLVFAGIVGLESKS